MGQCELERGGDSAAAAAVAGGDVEAFAQLVRRHGASLLAYVSSRSRHRHEAEDITQEAFLRAFRALRRPGGAGFRGDSSLKTWLFGIARNACTDHHRTRARRAEALPRLAAERAAHADPPDEADPPARLERAERDQRLRALRDRLPDAQREVITLKLYGGLSFEQIADVADCPVATARSRVRYGLLRIQQMLDRASRQEVAP